MRYLQAGLAQLRVQDHTVGGGALLPEALRQFTQARAMLDESDYTEAVGRELLIVAADLGLQSAWFAYDANNQPLARRLYQDAALLADNAGNSQQRVHLYANMAQQCTHLAQYTGRQGLPGRHCGSPTAPRTRPAMSRLRPCTRWSRCGDPSRTLNWVTGPRSVPPSRPLAVNWTVARTRQTPPGRRSSVTRRSPHSRRWPRRGSARPIRP
ncbi:MAG: hypothetical protein ACRDT0_13340 [Pseudonocardiaceae bacterium]